jgi:hypothetical protein
MGMTDVPEKEERRGVSRRDAMKLGAATLGVAAFARAIEPLYAYADNITAS